MLKDYLKLSNLLIKFDLLVAFLLFLVVINYFYRGIYVDYSDPSSFTKVNTVQKKIEMDNILLTCTLNFSIDECFKLKANSHKKKQGIWMGNSQNLSVIEKHNANNDSAIKHLYDIMNSDTMLVTSLSLPNANLQEQFYILNAITKDYEINFLILAIFLDDTREFGIRDEVFKFISNDSASLEKPFSQFKNHSKSESKYKSKISSYADEYLPYWSERTNAKNWINYQLYLLRNIIFNIDPSTKRKIIRSNYEANLEYLVDIITITKIKNIRLVLYNPPQPPSNSSFYDDIEYSTFLCHLKKLSQKNNFEFYDFTNIIPKSSWLKNPNKETYLDYMHFDEEGHKILANEIHNIIINNSSLRYKNVIQ